MTAKRPGRRPVRPAAAAGLVLLRGAGRQCEVLLGRRHPDMRFMPNVYAFPGGRLEPRDRAPSGYAETVPAPSAGLDRFTHRHLATLARTALRETYEETGLLVGTPQSASAPASPVSRRASAEAAEPWRSYRETGLQPAFDALHLVARAITPTDSRIRFHSRFFRAEGDAVRGRPAGNGELVDIGWVPVAEIGRLPMSGITALILRQALAHRTASLQGSLPPPTLFRWVGERCYADLRTAQSGPARPWQRALERAGQQA